MKSASIFGKYFCVCFAFILWSALAVVLHAAAPQRILVTDFGAKPGSREDAVPAVCKALEACKRHDSAVLVFPRGRYDFYEPAGHTYGITLDLQKNLTIDGDGSELVFHGIMGISVVSRSENITFRNFSVDWDSPFIVQGVVTESGDEYVDVRFDTTRYPFEIDNEKLYFIGENWRRPLDGYSLIYDKDTLEIAYNTADNALATVDKIGGLKTENLGNDVVRFHTKPRYKPASGDILLLGLGRYMMPGFAMYHSKDVTFADITIYHALSNGVTGFLTENITLTNVNLMANTAKGRVFSTIADGFHFSSCKGLIKIENCEHTGIGDDFLNVHGQNVVTRGLVDEHTLEVGIAGQAGASGGLSVGDEVWFIDAATMQRGATAKITAVHDSREGQTLTKRCIAFDAPIPASVKTGDMLENKTWCAALEMRGCKVLKKHRARGILVTTPKRVVIENNYFRTAGAAILIEGDGTYWYESGACADVLIRNNIFEDCFTSGHSLEWGRAVITIQPSFKPQTDTAAPYHRNIRIENNVFKSFDYPILFARSAGELKFTGNTLTRTKTYAPCAPSKYTFTLDGCRDVLIGENTYSDDFLGKNLQTSHMKPGDIIIKDSSLQNNANTQPIK